MSESELVHHGIPIHDARVSFASCAQEIRRGVVGVQAHENGDVLALLDAESQRGQTRGDRIGRLEIEIACDHIHDMARKRRFRR